MELKPLKIGDVTAKFPIIQGGMGIGVSLSGLAGAVAKEGGIGIISAAQPGYLAPDFAENPLEANVRCLKEEIKKAKELSGGGIIGVNLMRAAKNYDAYVKACVEAKADMIISGAGLPVSLPELLKGTAVKFAPIVSSLKAVTLLFKTWQKKHQRVSDFVVIEGPRAGGHLGFRVEDLMKDSFEDYDAEVEKIVAYVKETGEALGTHIPVIFAGGVFDRKDIDHYLGLGCDGVQMSTRFVATEECDASLEFKMAYINAKKEDIQIVKSPVGMPGRAIRNPFIVKTEQEKEPITHCYQCIDHCKPAEIPYCITGALSAAAKGDVDNGLLFCGDNAYRVDQMSTVKEIFAELTK